MPIRAYALLFLCQSILLIGLFAGIQSSSLPPSVFGKDSPVESRPRSSRSSLAWREQIEMMNQLDTLQARIDLLETQRTRPRALRDPFAEVVLVPVALAQKNETAHRTSEKITPPVKLRIAPVSVIELPSLPKTAPVPRVTVRPKLEETVVERVKIDGQAFSLQGLSEKQRKILRIIQKIPEYPTEYIRGTRYVRVGEKRYRDDCSNVLRIAYDAVGIDLFSEHHLYPSANGVKLIRKKGDTAFASTSSKTAKVGDIIVFDNTFDRNGNGRLDDRDTHAAIVVGIEKDGTVSLYNRVASGHRVYRMNLKKKSSLRGPGGGPRFNNVLRRVPKSQRGKTPRLTGELFASYVSVLAA